MWCRAIFREGENVLDLSPGKSHNWEGQPVLWVGHYLQEFSVCEVKILGGLSMQDIQPTSRSAWAGPWLWVAYGKEDTNYMSRHWFPITCIVPQGMKPANTRNRLQNVATTLQIQRDYEGIWPEGARS